MQVGAQGSGPGLEEETLANRLTRPTWVRVAKATDSTLLSLLAHHHVAGRGTRSGKRKPQSRAAGANFSLPKNTTPLPLQQKGKERRGGLGWGEQVRRKGGIPTSLAEMVADNDERERTLEGRTLVGTRRKGTKRYIEFKEHVEKFIIRVRRPVEFSNSTVLATT